ncbi:helix-turn-helix domain-containing protein [Christensenellaceae bacterium OttesenSCG-928-K19]|nr:helix-turn-helix domain-containing protein [Christensenellaceae bacterium OttesenSCG-928-K19]
MKYTIKQARKLSDKSQQEMAQALGVHVQTYRKIENDPDSATIEQARIISKETGIPYNEIFFIGESTNSRVQEGGAM